MNVRMHIAVAVAILAAPLAAMASTQTTIDQVQRTERSGSLVAAPAHPEVTPAFEGRFHQAVEEGAGYHQAARIASRQEMERAGADRVPGPAALTRAVIAQGMDHALSSYALSARG